MATENEDLENQGAGERAEAGDNKNNDAAAGAGEGAGDNNNTGEENEGGEHGAGAAIEEDDDIDEEKLLRNLNKKSGKNLTAVADYFKTPEPEKIEVVKNKYENISVKAQGFLDYHAETGRDYEDYIALQQDISAIPDIELARERVRQDTGQTNLTNEQVDAYLEKKLGIDLTDLEDMEVADKIELSAFTKEFRQNKIIEQEKYKMPLENQQRAAADTQELPADMVELENGQRMPKADYEKLVKDRNDYLKDREDAVNKITTSDVSINVDDNGTEKTLNYAYEFSKEDKQDMLSLSEDVTKTVEKFYRTENGFDHQGFQKAIWRLNPQNWEKEVSAIVHKALAERTEELLKEQGNVNLSKEDMVKKESTEGRKIVPISQLLTS